MTNKKKSNTPIRHGKKVQRDAIKGITGPAIRRLARRGGVKRIAGTVYEETRGVLKVFLENLVLNALVYTEYGHRKTVTPSDVVRSLRRANRTLYGFEDDLAGDRPSARKQGGHSDKMPATPAHVYVCNGPRTSMAMLSGKSKVQHQCCRKTERPRLPLQDLPPHPGVATKEPHPCRVHQPRLPSADQHNRMRRKRYTKTTHIQKLLLRNQPFLFEEAMTAQHPRREHPA